MSSSLNNNNISSAFDQIYQHYFDEDLPEPNAKILLTRGVILTNSIDQIKNKLAEDKEFNESFFKAIQQPPPDEIRETLAEKIFEVIPKEQYPDWVKVIPPKLSTHSSNQKKEHEFLKQCASSPSFLMPTDIDLEHARDMEGNTGLHLALMNSSLAPEMISALIAACPKLIFIRNFEGNYPLDLIQPGSQSAGTICRFIAKRPPSEIPGMSAFIGHLIQIKDPAKPLEYFSKALEGYRPESTADLDALKEPLEACAHLGSKEFARKAVTLIAERLILPKYALMNHWFPEWIMEEQEIDYLQQPKSPIEKYRPLLPGADALAKLGKAPSESDIALALSSANLRVLLSSGPNAHGKISKCYGKKPSEEFIMHLLLAVPENDPAASDFVVDLIKLKFKIIKDYLEFLLFLKKSCPREFFYAHPAGASIFNEMLLKRCKFWTRYDIEMFTNNINLLWTSGLFLKPEVLKNFLFPSEVRKSSHIYTFIQHWLEEKNGMNAEECLEVLKSFATNPTLCSPLQTLDGNDDRLAFYKKLLLGIKEEKSCEILDFMLTKFPLPNSQITELVWDNRTLFEQRTIAKADNIESFRLYLTILFVLQKSVVEDATIVSEDRRQAILSLIINNQEKLPKGWIENFKLLCSKSRDQTLKDLMLSICRLEIPEYKNILVQEIRRRPNAVEICSNLANKAISRGNNPINGPLLKWLLSDDFVFPKAEMVKLLNAEIARWNSFAPEEIKNIDFDNLKTLVAYGLNLSPLFKMRDLHSLMCSHEYLRAIKIRPTVSFILTDVLKKLPLGDDLGMPKPYDAKKAYEMLNEMHADVIRRFPNPFVGPISYPSRKQGFCYEVEPSQKDKTLTIFFKNQGTQAREKIFWGYANYDGMVETIEEHGRKKAEEDFLEHLSTTYAAFLVDPAQKIITGNDLIKSRKNMVVYIDKKNRKVKVHPLIPGQMFFEAHVFSFEQLQKDPGAIDKLLEKWKQDVESLHQSLQKDIGKDNCLFGDILAFSKEQENKVYIDSKTGQTALILNSEAKYNTAENVKRMFYVKEFQVWAEEKKGKYVGPRDTPMLSDSFNDVIPHLDGNWACLPWFGKGFWLFTKDIVSGTILCTPAWGKENKDRTLQNLMDIQANLGGFIINKEKLNTLVKHSSKKIHEHPAKVSLNDCIKMFESFKNEGWFLERVRKEKTSVESLESNLKHFLSCAATKKGITGWEDAVKHSQDYLDLEIYLTNTLEELFKRKDQSGLNQFVFEIAKHGRFCGNKVSEIAYQNYAVTFGIANMQSEANGLDEVLKTAYKQAFLETLELLIKFVEDPQAQKQSTHVLSYLRSTLADLGYEVPDDPNLAPLLQDGKNDRFNNWWGAKDYPKNILEQIFPAICLPAFIQKIKEAQDELVKNKRWAALGDIRQILNSRIEMGLEETILFPVDPETLEKYKVLTQIRQKNIKAAKQAVEKVEKSLKELEQRDSALVHEAAALESSMIDLSSRINEASEVCLSLSRRRQQIEVKLKSQLANGNETPEGSATKKRKFDFTGLPQVEQELQDQLRIIIDQQPLADARKEELVKHREAVEIIFEDSSRKIRFLGERERLMKELEARKKECKEIHENKPELRNIVEQLGDKEGYLCDGPNDSTILSLKGLLHVLIQESFLVPSEQLVSQWKAMKKITKETDEDHWMDFFDWDAFAKVVLEEDLAR